jgi:hypothetical protein
MVPLRLAQQLIDAVVEKTSLTETVSRRLVSCGSAAQRGDIAPDKVADVGAQPGDSGLEAGCDRGYPLPTRGSVIATG